MTFVQAALGLLIGSLVYTGAIYLVFKDVRRVTRPKHDE